MPHDILCMGEILWDALPDGLFLGGAPFNVACHLHALGTHASFVSRVGDDALGHEALRRLKARGLGADLMQIDASLPTGFVRVELSDGGEPDYEIVEPAAWDAITLTDALQQRADRADAIVIGSLAQRAATSRQTIQAVAHAEACIVFDVNMRSPYIDQAVIRDTLRAADVAKMNSDELQHVREWFGLPADDDAAMAALAQQFACQGICVTQGAAGARLWYDGTLHRTDGYAVAVADTVGAGDAFLAALLVGLVTERVGPDLLDRANRLGAYVASQSGATPTYPIDTLDDIATLDLAPVA